MKISMSAIWDDSAAFIRREAGLLVPLALATLAVGNAGAELSMDLIRATARGGGSGAALLGLLLSLLLIILGKLAVTSLVLVPRQSVGEAIRHAAQRLTKILAINIALGLLFAMLAVPLVIMLAKSGIDLTTPSPKLPAPAAFYILALFGLGLYLGARLITLNPTIMDRNPDFASLFKSCFAQTQGTTGKIIGIAFIYLVVTLVLTRPLTKR